MNSGIKDVIELGKVRISLSVAFSALTGYVLYTGAVGTGLIGLTAGVFLLSCASGALNHLQEKDVDAKMPRTQNRPLPSGRMSTTRALITIAGYALTGTALLLVTQPPVAALLSWITLFFYNAVYTPLKKVTAFAVIPGSMVGALPPLIGWTAAGGNLASEIILLVATFFFIGQIPHFWLLLLMFGDQYKLAGLPSLNQIFTESQIKRITLTWIITTAASALLVIFFVFTGKLLMFLLLFYTFYLLSSLTMSVLIQSEFRVKSAFYKLNLLYLFMMIFLVADSLYRT